MFFLCLCCLFFFVLFCCFVLFCVVLFCCFCYSYVSCVYTSVELLPCPCRLKLLFSNKSVATGCCCFCMLLPMSLLSVHAQVMLLLFFLRTNEFMFELSFSHFFFLIFADSCPLLSYHFFVSLAAIEAFIH